MDGLAVGVAAAVGKFVTQVDQAVVGEGERLIVEEAAHLIENGLGFAAAVGAGPDVNGEDVFVAGFG